MMEEKKSMENNQTPDNKEGKERILEIKEAGLEDVLGIISVLKENLLPMELLDKEKRDFYLKSVGKKIEDFSEKGFLVNSFSEEDLENVISDKEKHIILVAKKNDEIVGYALTYDLEAWRERKPDWEKTVELINKTEGQMFENKKVLYFRHIVTKQFPKNKGIGATLEYKIFSAAKQKGYKEIIGEALEYPIENKASIDFHRKIGFKKIGTVKESKNDLIWGLYKKDLES